jgi:hypothetical protein
MMYGSCVIGTILLFPGNFVPMGFLACNGQTLLVAKHPALYSIVGNTFNKIMGNPAGTFNLPKMTPPAGMTYIICVDGDYPDRPL